MYRIGIIPHAHCSVNSRTSPENQRWPGIRRGLTYFRCYQGAPIQRPERDIRKRGNPLSQRRYVLSVSKLSDADKNRALAPWHAGSAWGPTNSRVCGGAPSSPVGSWVSYPPTPTYGPPWQVRATIRLRWPSVPYTPIRRARARSFEALERNVGGGAAGALALARRRLALGRLMTVVG